MMTIMLNQTVNTIVPAYEHNSMLNSLCLISASEQRDYGFTGRGKDYKWDRNRYGRFRD